MAGLADAHLEELARHLLGLAVGELEGTAPLLGGGLANAPQQSLVQQSLNGDATATADQNSTIDQGDDSD